MFVCDGQGHGFPSYTRAGLDIWRRRLPGFGRAVSDAAEVTSRPSTTQVRDFPPEGGWVSRKGERPYVYDLGPADEIATGAEIP
ncbi:hypothetical protein [Nocardia sp. NPDC051750]|uniref:hypothetical protein n=1 Tax=Nocardia sp. NPDC051750 TaxID=3364325 RepID=UPI0037BC9A86